MIQYSRITQLDTFSQMSIGLEQNLVLIKWITGNILDFLSNVPASPPSRSLTGAAPSLNSNVGSCFVSLLVIREVSGSIGASGFGLYAY